MARERLAPGLQHRRQPAVGDGLASGALDREGDADAVDGGLQGHVLAVDDQWPVDLDLEPGAVFEELPAVGLGAAVDYLSDLGMEAVRAHEIEMTAYAMRTLTSRFGDDILIHGPSEPGLRGGVMSFAYRNIHPHDLSQVLNQHGVCVRPGHHCAKPLMRVLGVGATARASWYVYNDAHDVDALADALEAAGDFFAF